MYVLPFLWFKKRKDYTYNGPGLVFILEHLVQRTSLFWPEFHCRTQKNDGQLDCIEVKCIIIDLFRSGIIKREPLRQPRIWKGGSRTFALLISRGGISFNLNKVIGWNQVPLSNAYILTHPEQIHQMPFWVVCFPRLI